MWALNCRSFLSLKRSLFTCACTLKFRAFATFCVLPCSVLLPTFSPRVLDFSLPFLSFFYLCCEQDTIKPPAKYSRSEDVRQALVGRHYQTAVSRSAAADNAKGLADVTWRFEENLSLTSPTIWDRGMPEGKYVNVC